MKRITYYKLINFLLAYIIIGVVLTTTISSDENSTYFYTSLVGSWNFDEGSGNIVYDSSIYNNNGNLNGPSWNIGVSNGSISFDGQNDYALIPNDDSLNFADTNQFTISMWLKRDGSLTSYPEMLVSKATSAHMAGYAFKIMQNDSLKFSIMDGIANHQIYSIKKIDDDNWHHLAVVWDGVVESIYINGELDNSKSFNSISLKDDNKPLEFGNHYGYIGNYQRFHGKIDEVKIFECALTNGEINNIYDELFKLDIDQNIFHRGFPICKRVITNWGAAQSFKPNSRILSSVNLFVRVFGTPDFDLTVELRSGSPSGQMLDTKIFNPNEVSNNWGWLSVDFADTVVDAGTDYFVVCPPAPSGVTTSFGYEWGYAFGNHYDGGSFWFTRDGGALWRDLPCMYEFVFRTFGFD